MNSRLLARLAISLGRNQASQELRWMNHAISRGHTNLSLEDMVARRALGEPLQYILGTYHMTLLLSFLTLATGSQPFGPLNLLTRPPVLIPRPETEHWVLNLAESLSPAAQNPISLLDLGTGSGCIPLLLCHLWPPGSVHACGVDISPHAMRLATDNAALCGIPQNASAISPQNTFKATFANFLADHFPVGGLRTALPFDVITSNPPYIPWEEYINLPRSVSDYEDPKALFGGPTGLEFYHAIARFLCRKGVLSPNALVALEVGREQAEKVEQVVLSTGLFRHTEIWLDPWGKQRTVIARM
ncbi:uncharacterized protein LACBIDRAFT_313779 [Laccaria bicolor S238N-H82]|uniref:Predicted protein n=1 Tax=Laccaria bicolor (strain S238N-H82 / ATCC MYA-4686) TaxID=486041 RepID=B0D0T7_LACBS|nr:uncharacterized protein LACBIDRAFT_313779 [Laccaria bicolor S238N-H82]EDR11878.1 predicted protein [Laccaria bicolor S238N-H82]|eukprot:XP_001877775.1 predicted protein [Laccaria bicolor S238N-H82]